MTQHQYVIVTILRRIMRLKHLLGLFKRKVPQDQISKQAEIELAGQAAAAKRPPLDEPTIRRSVNEMFTVNGRADSGIREEV